MKTKILIVDDDPTILNSVSKYLSRDHEVKSVSDGLEAFLILREEKFDVLVVDFILPFMDGLTLLTAIREKKSVNEKIPVVLISADAAGAQRKINEEYFEDVLFLAKPFRMERLGRLVLLSLPNT